MKRPLVYTVLSIVVTAFALVGNTGVSAQTPSPPLNGNGLRVSPVRSDVTINAGTSQTVTLTVENITDSTANLQAVVNDFEASSDETGTPRILLDARDAPKRGLRRYIKPIPDFSIPARQSKDIPVVVTIPAGSTGGGYFGAVRFVPSNTKTDRNVSLSASVGSLLLATVPGNYTEQLNISSFGVGNANGEDVTFITNASKLQNIVRMRNSGDVQTQPFGKIIIKKAGKTIADYDFNNITPRASVLPDSTRRFEIDLQGKTAALGKYTALGTIGYGATGQTLSASSTFYVVPVPYLLAGLLVILILVAVIFYVRRRYQYRRTRRHRR